MEDVLFLGGGRLSSRLFIGTGKYASFAEMSKVILSSQAKVITLALRRVDLDRAQDNILQYIPDDMILLPNTSGARTAAEAIRIAKISRAAGLGNWIKIEVIPDQKYLLPDNEETIIATRELAKEGFIVLPYMNPDLLTAMKLEMAGAAAIMPLGAPIGSNRGLQTKEMIQILIQECSVPIIVDAGIGSPSDAAEAMEMGAAAVLVNTAISSAASPQLMAEAFHEGVKAGRKAYLAGLGPTSKQGVASSPLTHFLQL